MRFDHNQIKALSLDAVFISHYHDDHCSLESLNLLDRKTPIYIYCLFEEMLELIRELGFTKVYSLDLDTPVNIGSIEVTPRRALDADVDSLYQIKAAGVNVLNVVDSWIDYSTLDLLVRKGSWDMILWPFQTMRELEVLAPSRSEPASLELPPEWIEQLQVLNPRYVVPSSCQFQMEDWSWYNQAFFPITYQQFQKEIATALPKTQVIRLNPSVSVSLSANGIETASSLSWVLPVGRQDLDYEYNPDIKPLTTAEIARHFEPLTAEQTNLVYTYCTKGILDKYNSLEPAIDPYFDKPRLWQLAVYDHKGVAQNFCYSLYDGKIEFVGESASPIGWFTEVPIARLYTALQEGEALTSMYVRINHMVFTPTIENEIKHVDIMEDPLVRSLFNGEFASYQKAQLRRIKARKN
ncbi:MBL fold metallo-hydrolase [Bdellovibrio sp. HCB337]|uniref:MBL fold metallo-hydrolase n=1 Tax=Bdellovibrio sp. HCB337 TaxID=3394358 RepID=UPI0039A5E046